MRRLQHRITKEHTIPKIGKPFEVLDHIDENGKIDKRRYYGKDGIMKLDIHTTPHGNLKYHNFGNHGEHAHDFDFYSSGALKNKTTRELTKKERKENGDIL